MKIAIFPDNSLRFALANKSPGWKWVNTGFTVPQNAWSHIVWTYDAEGPAGGQLQVYVNGEMLFARAGTGPIGDRQPQVNELRIGGRQTGPWSFHGLIDEVRLYSQSLSEDDIKDLLLLPPSLAGHWAFDELSWTGSEGDVKDKSGHGNHGISKGAAQTVALGQVGRAGEFDGISGFVHISDHESLRMTTALTVTAWVKPDVQNTHRMILNKEGEYEIALFPDHSLRFALANRTPGWRWVNTGITLPQNAWSHIAWTYDAEGPDGSQLQVYVNGKKVFAKDGAGPIGDRQPKANELRIADRQAGPWFFHGVIDDVRLFNRSLTEEEVKIIFEEATDVVSGLLRVKSASSDLDLTTNLGSSYAPPILSKTIYEDAEDETITGWQVYGDGSVVNEKDISGNRIISTQATLAGDPFRLGLGDGSDWNNSNEFIAYFAILMEEEAALYFRVDTSDGEKFLCYRPGTEYIDIGNNVICFGLGIEPDGQWHAITRNLADDLAKAIPDSTLISIKDFYVFGSMKLDNLMLLKGNEID